MPVKEYLEVSETEQLEAAASCFRDKLLIRLPRMLGIRVSEVLGLRVEDIDFARDRVCIEHLKERIKLFCPDCGTRLGKKSVFCPGCGGKVAQAVAKAQEHRHMRTLPLDKETLGLLKTYIDKGGPTKVNGHTVLFNLTRQRVWQIFQVAAVKAGLPDIINPSSGKVHGVSPHKMRDAFAINAVKHSDSGDGIRLLQEHLGHQSIETTMKYRKVAGEELAAWYNELWGGKEPDKSKIKHARR